MRHTYKRNSNKRNICNAIDLLIITNQYRDSIDALIDEVAQPDDRLIKSYIGKIVTRVGKALKYINTIEGV